ncbi:MAG: hypothetical protein PHI71_05990 [Acidiphilium sp.]|jgi:hypothetical protein|nr:hypothetical protein [Acidiphilium sp.]
MDAYKIQVSMMLRNGVSAGLRLIRHDMGGVMRAMDGATRSTKTFGTAMIETGAIAAAAGAGILDVYEKIIRAGAKVINQQAAMAAIGVGPGQIAKNTNAAWKVSTSTSGVSVGGAMHTETMLRSMLGSSANARAALPAVERAKIALDTILGGHDGTSLAQALKAVDIVGGENKGKKISVSALLANLPYIEQAMLLTHGMVTGSQILRMTQQAGPAATVTSFRAMLANYTEAVMALGPAVGRGMFTSYMVANVGRAPAVSAAYLTKYGMVAPGEMHKVKGSSTFLFNPKDMLGHAYEVKHGFLDWVRHIVIPKLKSEGLSSYQQQLAALTGMFSASTAARLLAFIAHNGPQIDRFKHLFAKGVKDGHPYQDVASNNWGLATKNFATAWSNLVTALGVPAVKSAVTALNSITNGIHHMTAYLAAHPGLAKKIDRALLDVGGGLVAFGAALAGAGLVTLVGPEGLLVGLASSLLVAHTALNQNWAGPVKGMKTATTGLQALFDEIERFAGWMKTADRWLNTGANASNAAGHFVYRHVTAPIEHALGLARSPHSKGVGVLTERDGTWSPGPPPSAQPGRTSGDVPTVNIGNWGDGSKAIKHGLAASLNQNQGSTTGFNGRVSPYGTPAFTGP